MSKGGIHRASPVVAERVERFPLWHLGLWTLVVAALLTLFRYWTYTPDDGFIHLTYIRNLALEGTFSFSPGATGYGTTSPLWDLLLAIPVALGAAPLPTLKLAGFVFSVLSVVLADLLAFRIAGRSAGLLVGCIICCDPWFLRWAVSGLETNLVVAMVLGSIVLLHSGRPVWACVVVGLLPVVRPEMALYGLLFGCVLLTLYPTKRVLGLFAALLALPALCWAAFTLIEFGSILPGSVRYKSFDYQNGLFGTVVHMLKTAVVGHGLLLLATAGMLLYRGRAYWYGRDRSIRVLLLIWPPLLISGYLLSASFSASRYYLPATIVVYVVAGKLLSDSPRLLKFGVPLASCLVSSLFSLFLVSPRIHEYSRNFNLAAVEITDRLNELAAPGDIVASTDIGFLGYYNRSGYTILDMHGLVTPEMLVGSQGDAEYLHTHRPRFIVERRTIPNLLEAGDTRMYLEVYALPAETRLRFEHAAYLGPPGMRHAESVWYTLYSVNPPEEPRSGSS